jgi:tetratricopeptide (TPR) repeat protein
MSRDDEAPAGCAKALEREPESAEAWNNRALSLHQLHRYDEAIATFNRAIELKPALAELYNNRGITLQEIGRHEDALADYDRAIELEPDYANAHNNRGAVLPHLRRSAEALASCDTAIRLRPDFAEAYHNRGSSLHELARYEAALDSYDKALALKPDSAETHANRGASFHQLKRLAEASASCNRAIALKPDYAEPHQTLGLCFADLGDIQAAEGMYLKAIQLKPDFPDAMFSLTEIRRYNDRNHPDVGHILALLDKPGISYHGRECLYFALGKIYDDCGLYDEAFESYRQANQMRNTAVSYKAEMVTALTDQIIEIFSRDWMAQRFAFASDSESPLFIVGMPRSGTTLLTQILSNHVSIASAGELPTILEIISALPKLGASTIPYPQAAKHLAPAIVAQLTHEYEKRLRRDTGSEVARVIDKHPLNFGHLGFISRLFPKARIIHCTRHPLDTGLSNYFQRFSFSYDYSFDLRNIGHYYGEYSRIMEHWRNVLPATSMIEVSYEDMIANTEQVTRRILSWLGLEWDERCLAPQTNPYAVDTASKWQVRQPIYHRSVGRWRHYEKHLGPMKEVLRAYQVQI